MNRGKWTFDAETHQLIPYVESKPDVNAPFVITDEIPGGIKSMADRQMYTSKRRLRDSYRRLGFTEIGNDTHVEAKRERDPNEAQKLEEDMAVTYQELRDNQCEHTDELTKARCEIIDRNRQHYNYDNRERDEAGNVLE